MDAFHSFWSQPNKLRHGGSIVFPDYEQLTAVISALEWQKHNGSICMITDSDGASYFKKAGLSQFWNSIETKLDNISQSADPFLFWALGKLEALRHMKAPCVMLDTDLIVWQNIEAIVDNYDITAAHSEELNPNVYPERGAMRFEHGYVLPESWDFTIDAANTAFLCIRDEEFKEHYTAEARSFAANVRRDGLDPVKAMCFAEQRILPMCAGALNKSLGFLIELSHAEEQLILTHTWGFKQALDRPPLARHKFCLRCVDRIARDFPDSLCRLKECTDLRPYYEEYMSRRTSS